MSAASKIRSDLIYISDFLAAIRGWMARKGILEVVTCPLRSGANNEPGIASFFVDGKYTQGWLQSSPELAMKVLLSQQSGDIYQITSAFRDDPAGRWHQACFTMLEWYRVGFDMQQLMQETSEFLTFFLDCPVITLHLVDALQETFGIDHTTSDGAVRELCLKMGYDGIDLSRDDCLDFLEDRLISDHTAQDTWLLVHHYPPSQCTLAQADALQSYRFEWFYNGIEVGHGYKELISQEQVRERGEIWSQRRFELGLPVVTMDDAFLSCLDQCPQMSGVAFGLDRLFAVINGRDERFSIAQA